MVIPRMSQIPWRACHYVNHRPDAPSWARQIHRSQGSRSSPVAACPLNPFKGRPFAAPLGSIMHERFAQNIMPGNERSVTLICGNIVFSGRDLILAGA